MVVWSTVILHIYKSTAKIFNLVWKTTKRTVRTYCLKKKLFKSAVWIPKHEFQKQLDYFKLQRSPIVWKLWSVVPIIFATTSKANFCKSVECKCMILN